MPGRVRRAEAAQDDTLDNLAEALDQHLPAVFTAAQHTTASHRKHINTLHAVFLRCAKVTTLSSDGRYTRLSGEKAFGEKFREMVTFPLGVKKGTDQADRVIKFIAGFVGFAIEYGESTCSSRDPGAGANGCNPETDFKQRAAAGDAEEDDADDGPASRLVAQLLAFLLRGFQAKNKIARYRCVQLVALMINSLGEIECVFKFVGQYESRSQLTRLRCTPLQRRVIQDAQGRTARACARQGGLGSATCRSCVVETAGCGRGSRRQRFRRGR